jgi:hypothetical protein
MNSSIPCRSYTEALAYLGKKTERLLPGKATRIRKVCDNIAVKYHATDIVVYQPDGTTILNSGGWHTVTTKYKLESYSTARIYAEDGLWYIAARNGETYEWNDSSLYYDGVVIKPNGMPVEPRSPEATKKLKSKLDKLVKKYIAGYIEHIREHGLDNPSGGDCWGCCMREVDTGKTDMMGYDHYFSHFADHYYVPSLLANAFMRQRGDNQIGYVWHMTKHDIETKRYPDLAARALRSWFKAIKSRLLDEMRSSGKGLA